MARNYYTVVVRDTREADWEIHFGDYDRSVALQEKDDVLENDTFGYAKLISSDDNQVSINAEVARINALTRSS